MVLLKRKSYLSLFLCIFLSFTVGCAKREGADESVRSYSKVVGASLLTQTHVFYQDLAEAMRETAKERGLNLKIQYAEFDPRRQNDQIEMFIHQKVDALIIAPTDSSGISPLIKEASNRGLPVFTVDITAKDAEVVCHIASDNYQGGYLLGRFLAEQLNGKGKIAIIDHPTVTSVQERVRGFEDAVKEFPNLEIVQKVPGDGQRDKAMRTAQDLIASRPDLDAIFGINDDSALGALAAVESAGLENKIKIVGFDATPEACSAILEGKSLIADIAQYPKEIGRSAIEIVAEYFEGKQVPKIKQVPVRLITREILLQERSKQDAKS